VVWTEVTSSTTVYRWTDIVEQTGLPAFAVYNFGFFAAQFFGILLAHGLKSPGAGAGAGLGLYVVCTITAIVIARSPDIAAPRFTKKDIWNSNTFLRRFWYLAFYSVSQYMHK
jgi:solute carrier family 6 GABA transporter-like protein 1